ncbi:MULTISPECIES: hypothetical protein [unclassified Lysinibacillus]|uniref:hypothetical protein n=1 Tax=unclassified Lysinibacillus TaxID=2636778 RepID=UPI0020119666|nr:MULTISPECIES: hypothetical protein [unclassified Lysinibacillus]MCL1695134.1 hypothetical protein [Lysinibacillus sp. BPa_S21]MCL1701196.1 hypothetical protein [Lysinibacillus sp. Bpr_S20]
MTEVEQMNNEIGFDKSLKMQNSEITPSFIPAILISITKYLIGTAGAVIFYHVITYGIIKACKNLKGDIGSLQIFVKQMDGFNKK